MAVTPATRRIDDNDYERIIPVMQTAAGITPIRLKMNDKDITAAIMALEVAAGVTPLHLRTMDRKDWPAALYAIQTKLNTRTVTMTIASPGVVTLATHGYTANTPIRFSTTGALPTGVNANTIYYVASTGLAAGTFQFSATPGGASIATTGTQSGTHSVYPL